MPEPDEFRCEVCGEWTEDRSYEPLCTECYWESEEGQDVLEEGD